MSVEYTKKTWYDGSEGGTPITAAELNRVETGIDDVVTQSNADKTNIDTHLAKKVNSSDGAHGLRYYNSELDYYDDTNEEWVEIQTGGGGTTDYTNLTNKPSINGVELLGNKTIGLLSGNIQVDSDKIGYNNAISGLSATNVKSAIDELANSPVAKTNIEAVYEETTALSAHSVDDYIYMNNLLYRVTSAISIGDSIVVNTNVELADDIEEGTEAYISNLPGSNVPNYPDLTNKPSINGVELLGNKLVGLLSTDIHINADNIGYSGTVSGASTTRAAIDALQSSLSGLHGIPSGGNTNQVLAKNSSSDYDLKWVNQTGGGGVGTVINLTTLYSALFNQTVTLTGTYDTYTATFDSTGHATVNVFYVDTYAVTCQGSTDSVTVTAIGLVINADVFSVAVVNLTTPYSALFGQTVSLTGSHEGYTTSFDSSGHATFNVLYTDTFTVTCQGLTDSVTVSALGIVVNATVFDITAVTLSSSDSQLVGATCTIYKGNPTDADVRMTTTLDSTLSFTFQTDETGSYTLNTTYSGVTIPTTFTVSSIGTTMSVTIESVPLKTWATATTSELTSMVDAADKGYIDLYEDCGWRVEQERTVHLPAMSATGVGESHAAQDVILVLSHRGGKTLTTPTASGRTTCSFQFDVKDCLKEKGYINSGNTNAGGWTSCARRAWCNNVFKNAMLNALGSIFKQFQNKTSAGGGSSTINTDNDFFALRSEMEIYGTTTYSAAGEGSQVDYYKTTANRIKKVNSSASDWWERSPITSTTADFCIVTDSGNSVYTNAYSTYGISPFGVI